MSVDETRTTMTLVGLLESYALIGLILALAMLALVAKEIWVNLADKAKRPVPSKAAQSYALVLVVTTALWPLVVPVIIRQKVSSWRDNTTRGKERTFSPTAADLVTKLSAAEIEARELVFDPLGAAPDLPFGHLNEAWRAFRSEVSEAAEFWSYSVNWENRWHQQEHREGYVALLSGQVGPFFQTVHYRVEDQG